MSVKDAFKASNDISSDGNGDVSKTVSLERPPEKATKYLIGALVANDGGNYEIPAFSGEGGELTQGDKEALQEAGVPVPETDKINVEDLFDIEFDGEYVGSVYTTKAEKFDWDELEEVGWDTEELDPEQTGVHDPRMKTADGELLIDIDTNGHRDLQTALNAYYVGLIWRSFEEGAKLKVGVASGSANDALERRKYLKFRISNTDNTKGQVLDDVQAAGRITGSEKEQILNGEKDLLEVLDDPEGE